MRTAIRTICILLFSSIAALAADQPAISYEISLKDATSHYATVKMFLPMGSGKFVQLPVWNATYQVRDFAHNVSDVSTTVGSSREEAITLDKTTWTSAILTYV